MLLHYSFQLLSSTYIHKHEVCFVWNMSSKNKTLENKTREGSIWKEGFKMFWRDNIEHATNAINNTSHSWFIPKKKRREKILRFIFSFWLIKLSMINAKFKRTNGYHLNGCSFKLIERHRPDERKLGPKSAFNLWRIKHWDAIKKEVWILLHFKRIIWQ